MRRLEAVYLRNGAGYYNAHGIGHIVLLERFGYRLLKDLGAQADDVGIIELFLFGYLFFSHKLSFQRFLPFVFAPVMRFLLHLGQLTALNRPRYMRLPQLGHLQYTAMTIKAVTKNATDMNVDTTPV